VLGSTQVAPPAGALPIVRRRGGGGAVIVRPDALVWIDVVLPRDDPLWDDDVARAFLWLGDAWAATLEALGVSGTSVHTGAAVCTPLCRSVCFGGLGSGEVTVDGVKAVGMSQRRTRAGAVFQSCLLREWDPAAYVEVLDLPAEGGPALAEAALAFTDLSVDAVESAFLATLRQ
jgi:lipoate-protein ligase A